MTVTIMVLLWGSLTAEQRHRFLKKVLDMELRKTETEIRRPLVAVVEAALRDELTDDEIIEQLTEVIQHGRT